MELKNKVRQVAEAKGYKSIRQLALDAKIGYSTARMYWQLDNYLGSPDTLCKLAKALGLTCPNDILQFVMTDEPVSQPRSQRDLERIAS